MTKKKGLLIAFVVLIGLSYACSSDTQKDSSKPTTSQTQQAQASLPDYKTTSEKLSQNRLNVIVTVDSQINEEQAKAIAEKVIKDNSNAKGIYIDFTDNPYPGNGYTLGQFQYGPNGSAAASTTNDKKELTLTTNNFAKDWSKRPTKEEYKFNDEMMKFAAKHPELKDSFKEFVKTKGITEEEGNKIVQKVAVWMISGNPQDKK